MYTLHTTTPGKEGGTEAEKERCRAQRQRKRDRQAYKRNASKHRNEQKL